MSASAGAVGRGVLGNEGRDAVNTSAEITQLLQRSNEGDVGARERVLELLYQELHRIARRHGKSSETLRPTALINEAYLKLFGHTTHFQNRENLLAYAALAMRQIVLNKIEKAGALKRGGDAVKLTLQEWDQATSAEHDYVALNQVLEQLEAVHPRHAKMLALRFFAGFENKEIADLLEVSEATVYKDLRFAKAWVNRKLTTAKSPDRT